MTPIIRALAAIVLWDSGRFDTSEIATALEIAEADVARVLHVAREERRARA